MIQSVFLDEWQQEVPWTSRLQVEQDLVICRAISEIFSNKFLSERLAFRGGTALNKLFVPTPTRYSEDIDLVQIRQENIGETIDALRSQFESWLGSPKRKIGHGRVTLYYRFMSEKETPLRLKVEINSREHYRIFDLSKVPYSIDSGWFKGQCEITTYCLEELLGTKFRALFQRKKGRDLFDLWYTFKFVKMDKSKVFDAFRFYMQKENRPVSKREFLANLENKKTDHDFTSDIWPIKSENIEYNFEEAFELVCEQIEKYL